VRVTAVAPTTDQPFKIEQHGIDVIPDEERHGEPRDLFWVWAGSLFGIVDFVIGAVVISLGLTIWQAVTAIIVGDLSYILLGLGALAGPAAGTSTIVISRAPFGNRGNHLPTLLSWLTIIGWEGVNSVVGVLTIAKLLDEAGLGTGDGIKVVALVIFLAALAVFAVWGHATIVKVNKFFTYALGISMIGILYFGLKHVDWHYGGAKLAAGSHFTTWLWAVTIVAASNGYGFMNMPADYTRYLPRAASKSRIVWYTFVGAFIPTTLLQAAGAIIGTRLDMFDPVASLSKIVPGWFLVPFLLIAGMTMIAVNVINTYSSGLNLLALGLRIPRYLSVIADVVLVSAFVSIALFVTNFVDTYTNFLTLTIWWVAPWTGIFLVDMFRRKFVYRSADFFRRGIYWYDHGFNYRALAALVVGAIVSWLCTNSTLVVGPIAKALNGADISVVAGTIVGGALYWALDRRPASLPEPAPEPERVASAV
jgi:nucleobase:cation symporter-1, NCS1 family